MPTRTNLFFLSALVSTVCLAAGFGLAGQWIGSALSIATGLAWLQARKYPATWLPQICLSMAVVLAAAGLLTGAASWLMMCGSGLALAAWDLVLLENGLRNSSQNEQTTRLVNKHFVLSGTAMGLGMLAAITGRLLNFRLPFLVMLLLVGLALFGFGRIWDILKKRDKHAS